jgi:hypothetical protein
LKQPTRYGAIKYLRVERATAHVSNVEPRSVTSHEQTPVHDDNLTGQIPRSLRRQEHGNIRYILRLANSA